MSSQKPTLPDQQSASPIRRKPAKLKPVIPILIAPRTDNHHSNPVLAIQRRISLFLTIWFAALTTALILIAFYTFKGYQVKTVSRGTYSIEVNFDRDDASAAIRYMNRAHQDRYLLRDVRLPDGTLAPIYLDRISANSLLISDNSQSAVTSTWRLSDYTNYTIDEEQGTITQYVRLTYREIKTALTAIDTDHTEGYLIQSKVALPNSKAGSCWLSATELENYRRRMHTIGATSIFLPFTWYLDSSITSSIPTPYIP